MKRLWFFLLLSGLNPFSLSAQNAFDQFTVRHWTTREGLPSDALSDIVYGSEGFIWLSSFNGLVRFDGVNLESHHFSFPEHSGN
ncbi:MAG: hypothetical protein AAFU64_03155 [Bacteroidota bacterium]